MYPIKKLWEICDIQNWYAFKSDDYVEAWSRLVRITNVQYWYISDSNPKFLPLSFNDKYNVFSINKDDILISLTWDVWRVAIYPESLLPALLNQRVWRFLDIDRKLVDRMYLFFYLNNSEFEKEVIKNAEGAAQKNTSTKKIKDILIPLPSLPIQQKIVSKLDASFANLNNQINLLKQNISNIEELNKSVLEKVFNEGEFEVKKLGEIVNSLSGWTPSKNNKSFWSGTIPWISPKDMKRPKLDNATDYVSEDAVASSATRLLPVNSLLCVTRSGILVHSFPVAINIVPVAFNQDIRAMIPWKNLNSEYLYYILKAKERQILSEWIKKWPTVHSIISWYLDSLLVPLPSLPKQKEIVSYLDQVFEKNKVLKQWFEGQIQALEELKQSLLKDAFEGRLVQD